jgi:hypothetical protein
MSVTKRIDLHFFLKQIPFCWLCMLFVIVMEWEVLDFAAFCAGIFKQSMGARNQVGIEWSFRPARLHSLSGIGSLESILGLLKKFKNSDSS